ncbi:MAG TPA: ester cyclase, partial [Acidimicrobiales bacterium]|nr:ester cyclase [Acidimicrobiales bacterium]
RDHDPASPWVQPSPEGMKEKVAAYRSAFPDLHFTIDQVLSTGDHVVTPWRCRGTHEGEVLGLAPTGKTIEIEGISIFRLQERKDRGPGDRVGRPRNAHPARSTAPRGAEVKSRSWTPW